MTELTEDMEWKQSIINKFQHVDYTIDMDVSNLTPIQEFYKDTKIFITGCTGFLGQILLEKLLRSCPVSTIYILIRAKNNQDVNSRLEPMFDEKLFDRLRKVCPDFRQKIVTVEGDCSLPDLGLSDQDKKLLINEVNIVFHIAATVRFDEKLKKATNINVKATRDLSLLTQKMMQLKSFVYVSTAFSNCINNVIEERVYPPPVNYHHLLEIIESVDDLLLNNITKFLVGNYPNTYVYTKQIAEDVVKQETKGLPSGIFRPAIVISTYKEPIRGWINNIYGATGVFYGAAVGLLRVLYCDEKNNASIIPVDMCINGLIASAWDISQRFTKANQEDQDFDIPVYNYESTNDKPIDWGTFRDISSKCTIPFASTKCVWYYFHLYLVKSYNKYLVMQFFLHVIPGMVADVVLYCKGKKLRIVEAYKKIHTFSSVISYFTVRSFDFKSFNVRKMLSRMTEKDKEVFFCDLKQLDWEEFFGSYGIGARVYLAKDPIETIPEGNRFYKKLEWTHKTMVLTLKTMAMTFMCFLLYLTYKNFILK